MLVRVLVGSQVVKVVVVSVHSKRLDVDMVLVEPTTGSEHAVVGLPHNLLDSNDKNSAIDGSEMPVARNSIS